MNVSWSLSAFKTWHYGLFVYAHGDPECQNNEKAFKCKGRERKEK